MSSTRQQGEAQDFYETPAWCVDRLLDSVGDRISLRNTATWLEPAFGSGAIVRAVNRWAGEQRAPVWATVDLVCRDPAPHVVGNFLDPSRVAKGHDVVLTNPPFKLALPFVRRSLEVAGIVVMLLRVSWLGSEDRHPWLAEHTPSIYLLPQRPSFRGSGQDSDYYAWMAWGLDREPRFELLGLTSLEQRRERRPWSESPQLKLDVGR